MCCALNGFSTLKCGNTKQMKDQHVDMSSFYHGVKPNYPSQISLLCNASYSYRALFDSTFSVATQKSDDSTSTSISTLKKSLTRDKYRDYYSGTDINVDDMEKKNRTTPQLISGRQLHDVAKRVKNGTVIQRNQKNPDYLWMT